MGDYNGLTAETKRNIKYKILFNHYGLSPNEVDRTVGSKIDSLIHTVNILGKVERMKK